MQPLWVTEPRRLTCLANVTAVGGEWFSVDRALFAPKLGRFRHHQPHDQGTVWWDGEKHWLSRVVERDGRLWYHVDGDRPPMGAQLNCQLDQDRRGAIARAHTAMHLLIHALQPRGAVLAYDPEVKLGRTFRLELARPVPPKAVADALAQANQWVKEARRIRREPVLRDLAPQVLSPQAFEPADPFPGPADVLDAVHVEGVCGHPCDGHHVAGTQEIGTIRISHLKPGRTMTLIGKVG